MRNYIDCWVPSDLESISVSHVIECSGVEVSLATNKYVLVCIYRINTFPLAVTDVFFEKLNIILAKLTKEKISYFIVGDFNINLLSISNKTKIFQSIVQGSNARIIINEPTRVTSATCEGNIITNFICLK